MPRSNENYLRMLCLFLPYFDHKFFYIYELKESEELKNMILVTIPKHGQMSNIDMTESIIKSYYFKTKYTIDDFFDILDNASAELLTYHHNILCVDMFDQYLFDESKEYDFLFKNKILDYLELNKMISSSLLAAFYNVHCGYDIKYCITQRLPQPISVVNHQLEVILSKGIAETHTHVVGSIPFEKQWNWLAHEIYDNTVIVENLLNELDDNKSVLFQKERYDFNGSLTILIKSVMVIRCIMIFYLNYVELNENVEFWEFIKRLENQLDSHNKVRIVHLIRTLENKEELSYLNNQNCNELINSISEVFYSSTKNLSKRVCHDFTKNYGIDNGNDYIEYILQHLSIEHIKSKDDRLFKKSFLYYIRVKNFVHSFIVQSTDIKGFLEFQYFFRRIGTIYNVPEHMFDNIFKTYLYENVRFLEIRIGHVRLPVIGESNRFAVSKDTNMIIKIYYQTILKFIKTYIDYLEHDGKFQTQIPQAGLILHFNKRYDDEEKCWDSYFRVKDDSLLRYKTYQEECFLNLIIFQYLREEIPYGHDYLIGIDGASNELLMEPWVLAPIFRTVKDKYSHVLKNKALNKYGIKLKPIKSIGITYHVGEVFHSLASGLRHVDEVIDYYGFQNDGRIGHGTVLGIEIDEYIARHSIVSLPAIELLDNLLWLYHLKSHHNLFKNISISYLEENIWKIVHYIYNDEDGHINGEISIHHLYHAYRNQFRELERLDFNNKQYSCSSIFKERDCTFKANKLWDENQLLLSRHCRCFLRKMTRFIQIDVDDDTIRQIYQEAQLYVINKIAHKGINVETNPVSNVNIGELYGMDMHPIMRLNDTFDKDYKRVMVSINTDDPGVFSTTLKNQYGFILQMLYKQGIPMEKALRWIDQVRETGLNSTFLNRRMKSREEVEKELREIELFINKQLH